MKKGQPAEAPNAAVALPFHVECQWRGVGNPWRSSLEQGGWDDVLEQFAGYSARPKRSFGSALRHANAFSFSRPATSGLASATLRDSLGSAFRS